MVVSFSPGSLMIPKFSLPIKGYFMEVDLMIHSCQRGDKLPAYLFFLITISFPLPKDLVGRALVF